MDENLTDQINALYNRWLTSIDPIVSNLCWIEFWKLLKTYTSRILYHESEALLLYFDEFYSDMIFKVYYSQQNNLIDTLDFFCNWYRKAVKNHIVNYHLYLHRDKRINIENESQSGRSISDIENDICVLNFYNDEHQQELAEIFNSILPLERDNSLFYDRHVYGITEEELAKDYDTTVDGVKGRLKRAKKRLYIAYNLSNRK